MNKYIAFDIGGTKVKHAVIQEDGTFIEKGKYHTNREELDGFLDDMVNTINKYKKEYDINGVAISMPGFVDVETGFTPAAGAITILNGVSLKNIIEEKVNIPIEVENDGNCVALSEKFNGNATECDSFICVTIGTGIGGGIYLNNKIVHGHAFRGGEFGFMVTLGGQKGNEVWHHNGATSGLVKKYKKYKNIPESELVEGHTIFEEAEKDEGVHKIVDDWLLANSLGIYNLAATLNPEKILIGGGVSEREDLISGIKKHLDKMLPWPYIKVPIERCKHKNDAGMLGALHHYLTRRLQK